jgi:hypothetical protein
MLEDVLCQVSVTGLSPKCKEATMDDSSVPKAKVLRMRRSAPNFIVEDHIDALRWPQQCSNCGGPVEHTDSLEMSQKYKNYGRITVKVSGIPYCSSCMAKGRTTSRLNTIVLIAAFVIGIPLFALFGIQWLTSAQGGQFCAIGFALLGCIAIGYGIAWLLIKLPAKIILRKRLIKPIKAMLVERKKSDGKQGICVSLEIPNREYADRFAQLNEAVVS